MRELIKRFRYHLAVFFAVVGPGFITAVVDNDSGGIYTYSAAGARYGYLPLWTLLPITVALIIIQEMSSRMGAVTGKGLSDLIREEFGLRITFLLMGVLVLAAASRRAACREVAQQGVGVDRLEAQPFCVQPPGEVQEIEGIGAHAGGRVVPVGEIGEVVVAQLEVRRRTVPYESPALAASGHSQRSFHGTSVTQHEPVERKRESLWILRIHCPQNPHDPQATTTTDGSLAG